eukprot:TRINITY_DN63270_c0_g1_i1.p1 TRINITY_DN63270_c0_g1~~TRINITY_DN63270_c0_g1_i1.p1  ORF type:complete len:187 (-),score=10.54 TRINITY_DN63270_c0_g1_i1:128-688(-)
MAHRFKSQRRRLAEARAEAVKAVLPLPDRCKDIVAEFLPLEMPAITATQLVSLQRSWERRWTDRRIEEITEECAEWAADGFGEAVLAVFDNLHCDSEQARAALSCHRWHADNNYSFQPSPPVINDLRQGLESRGFNVEFEDCPFRPLGGKTYGKGDGKGEYGHSVFGGKGKQYEVCVSWREGKGPA